MQKIEWLPTEALPPNSPESVWLKVEYVLVGGNLRLKAVIKGKVVQNGYAGQIEPDPQDLLSLNRNAAVDGDWNPEDGKSIINVTSWTPRVDEVRPLAFAAIRKS